MTLHLGVPQLIWIALTIMGLTIAAYEHGKPRSASSFWPQLISAVLVAALLVWGGFFK